MKASTVVAAVITALLSLTGCVASQPEPLYQSESYYNYIQPSFSKYLSVTKQWLADNRGYISEEHGKELAMNMPFELLPERMGNRAILLVHGLGDSPYSFSDLGRTLQQQGFYVQALLLPGHGSKPSDLKLAQYHDWQGIVDHYAKLLKENYDEVWLGGFSTGGNLVTIHSIESGGVDGLILFSPGFQSQAPLMEKLAPLAAVFFDGYTAKEDNMARYNSAPLNGAIAYSDSAARLRELLKKEKIAIPTLIALSEADSIIDPVVVSRLYREHFVYPENQLLWYGETNKAANSATSYSMKLAAMKISTASHMSPLFAPTNPYYGKNPEYRMCMNSMDSDKTTYCEQGGEVWWSAWGYEEEGKVHARLTWNPYYQQLEQTLMQVTSHD